MDSLITGTYTNADVPALSTNNYVTSTIWEGRPWWDPQNPLTISGVLRDHHEQGIIKCYPGPPVANADSVIVYICPPAPENGNGDWNGNGHTLCGVNRTHRFCHTENSLNGFRQAFAPGTDSSGRYEVTIIGGGVSFLAEQDPDDYRGSTIILSFKKDNAEAWFVRCGTEIRGGPAFCPDGPDIYARLSSPDLTGDGYVDSQDFGWFGTFYGKAATPFSGWQVDYNQSGWVDSGDFGLFSGRFERHCSGSSKSGGISFDMDVQNLTHPVIVAGMSEFGITSSQIIAYWEEMGLTYDHELADQILASSAASVQHLNWGNLKKLYKDANE